MMLPQGGFILKMKKSKMMKKLCLFISVAMLFSLTLTSCGTSGASVDDVVRRTPITLSIYVPGDISPEASAEVNKALNDITQQKLTTKIEVIYVPMSNYIATIENLFAKYDEAMALKLEQESIAASIAKASKEKAKDDRAKGITEPPTKKPTDPPKTTEFYQEKIVYDALKENQLDIFLIPSAEMFESLVRESRLLSMDEELTTKAKILYEYIHPSVMLAGKYGESTYAIPTNRVIGETTYMAINKRLLEEYNAYAADYNAQIEAGTLEGDPKAVVDLTKVKEFDALTDYLRYVKANAPNVALVEGLISSDKSYEPLFPEYPNFVLAANAGKSSVYTASYMPVPTEPKTTEPPTDENGNLLPTETEAPTIPKETVKPQPVPAVINNTPDSVNVSDRFKAATMSAISKLNQLFRDEGLFASGAVSADAERAAFLRTGTLEDYYGWIETDQYEYEYITYQAPRATKQQLQSSMFGIFADCSSVARAMEVITLLNTNTTFKNTFQYGVQGTHYIVNDNQRIERLNDDYMMDMNHTGNNFIAGLMEGDNPDKWEIAKEHNLQVINSVFLNFYLDRSKLPEATISALNTISEKYYNEFVTGQFTIPNDLALPEGVELDVSTLTTYSDRLDVYVQYVMLPEFEAAGLAEFLTLVKEQTSPAE